MNRMNSYTWAKTKKTLSCDLSGGRRRQNVLQPEMLVMISRRLASACKPRWGLGSQPERLGWVLAELAFGLTSEPLVSDKALANSALQKRKFSQRQKVIVSKVLGGKRVYITCGPGTCPDSTGKFLSCWRSCLCGN